MPEHAVLSQGCKMSIIAVEEAKLHVGSALSSPGNGSCESRNAGHRQKRRGKSYPWIKPPCNPFLPETFPIWWGPLEKLSRCYRAETLCSGSEQPELGGLSAGRRSGSKTAREREPGRAGARLQALPTAAWAAPCRGSGRWCILQSNPSWEQTGDPAVTKHSSKLFTLSLAPAMSSSSPRGTSVTLGSVYPQAALLEKFLSKRLS